MAAIGFLSIFERPEVGIVGGYLVVTPQGRPLEFHCSAPMLPNRAQEILYGPTLRPFLFGEIIGDSLIKNAKLSVDAVFIDQWEALSLRESIKSPLSVVLENTAGAVIGKQSEFGDKTIATAIGWDADLDSIQTLLRDDGMTLTDLTEPFERVQAAIKEAHQMAA